MQNEQNYDFTLAFDNNLDTSSLPTTFEQGRSRSTLKETFRNKKEWFVAEVPIENLVSSIY